MLIINSWCHLMRSKVSTKLIGYTSMFVSSRVISFDLLRLDFFPFNEKMMCSWYKVSINWCLKFNYTQMSMLVAHDQDVSYVTRGRMFQFICST